LLYLEVAHANCEAEMRFYLGIFLSAVVVFFWGFVMWGLLAIPCGMLKPLPKEESIVQAIVAADVPTGVYVYPFPDPEMAKLTGDAKKAAEEAMSAKTMKGPIVRVFVDTQGRPYPDPNMFLVGFLHMLLAAAILASLTRSVLSWASFTARYA